MTTSIYSKITGTGAYIPSQRIPNQYFLNREFYQADGQPFERDNAEIIQKFEDITTIAERRYVSADLVTSDIAHLAAVDAIASAAIDPESLDLIIVAHNFGDVRDGQSQLDIVPSLAARVKYKLQISNPDCVAFDLTFGCPGWLQAVIQADYYLRSGDAKTALVIGAETLSRVTDPHDRDTMLYADGAGAVILQAETSAKPTGIVAHKTRSDAYPNASMLSMAASYHDDAETKGRQYLKMEGRKLYQYALEQVPEAIKGCLERSGIGLESMHKLLLHQANGKMDEAILQRLYQSCGIDVVPPDIMPMTIETLGNSSVATLPTLLHLILTEQLPPHELKEGQPIVFASVGAGMNINALVYLM